MRSNERDKKTGRFLRDLRPVAICSVDGCERKVNAFGYCQKHYNKAKRLGWVKRPPCAVDGCSKPSFRKKMCNTHYLRVRRYGDPSVRKKSANGELTGLPCAIDGCDLPRKVREHCDMHAARFRRHGDPHKTTKPARATPEHAKATRARAQRRYRQTPHGKLRSRFNARKWLVLRGRCLTIDGAITKDVYLGLWAATTCAICGREMSDQDKSLDHKVPISRGGAHTIENLQVAHLRCNQRKGNKME